MATILIVDDIATNRDLLVAMLQFHGHRLLEAADGKEGLALARLEKPDLVISDVLMPVMDGYELFRQLRLDPATHAIPVVFYTAHFGDREARAFALSSGVSDILTKPVQMAHVLKVVAGALAPKPAVDSQRAVAVLTQEFDRTHLRLLTDKLSEKVGDLTAANAKWRALISIGAELASEGDSDRRLENLCTSACDLFEAAYVTLGIVDMKDRTVRRFSMCGADAPDAIKPGDAIPGILEMVVSGRRVMRGVNPGGGPARLNLPAGHPPIHSYLAVPIASSKHVYGWILLAGKTGRVFTEDDEYLVMVMSGQVARIHQLEQEILDRKRAASALRRERDRSQRYLDNAAVILLALDTEGRVTLMNAYGCAILGWTAEELQGRDWIDTCLPPRIRGEMRGKFAELLSGGLAVTENPVLTKSGEERLIEWRNILLRDASGRVTGTFTSGTDLTDRHRAVAALRVAEERMRFALESAGVGIWDMDYATGVLRLSETLENHFGLAPGAFDGTFETFMGLAAPDDRASLIRTVEVAMKSGADFSTLYRANRADGKLRWLSGAGRIHLGENGEPLRGVGIVLDVTGQHTLEEQYLQAQKMEAVGRLAGGVAHDFNNLLTGILGYCELLLSDVSQGDPRRADIMEIQRAGTSAAALTRQLLTFSRKQIIQPKLLDLSAVIADVQALLGRLLGEDVAIVVQLDADEMIVNADRGQLEQVIMNLALNARDAMPKGGTLTISTAHLHLDADYATTHLAVQSGEYVVLTVSDTGSGMTPDVQARLFEPFFTTKEPGKGTGLGLATVHGIVTASGGSINVYTEVGKGTTFKVYFPRAQGAGVAEPVATAVAQSRARETVLVVDDAEGLRGLTKRLLERHGYTVLVAANAIEALARFEHNGAIDVILTDVVMPGASGPELTASLIERWPALKVIYMSGYTEDAIINHGVLDPGISFLHKPFTSDALGRKMREVLDR